MQWHELIDQAQESWTKRDLKLSEMRLFEALKLLESTGNTYDTRLLPTLELLTELLLRQEKIITANPLLLKLLDAQMRLPNVSKLSVAKTLQRLAEVSHYQLFHARAISFGSRALAIFIEVFGKNSVEVAESAHKLAIYHQAFGQNDLAESYYKQSVSSLAQAKDGGCANAGTLLKSYAAFLQTMHRSEEAQHLIYCAATTAVAMSV